MQALYLGAKREPCAPYRNDLLLLYNRAVRELNSFVMEEQALLDPRIKESVANGLFLIRKHRRFRG